MVSLFNEEPTTPTHKPNRKRNRTMPAPECHSKNLLQHNGPIQTYRGPEVDNSYVNYGFESDMHRRGQYHAMQAYVAPAQAPVNNGGSVSYTPTYDSDYAESDREDHPPSKIPKINKDGAPRKPRQPRPKLLKWSDNDWKNVVLGIVWACGETGVQIPFDQAGQVVGESCTAGALQQAILKLRGKQIAEGYQIPSLRMAWTRKNKRSSSLSSTANTNSQTNAGQDPLTPSRPSLIVKLKVPVSKSVGVKHSPGFNKAGADTVREESKEKVQVLNEAQDQKPVVVDDDVFNIDSHRAHNKDSDVDYLQSDGDASKVGQGFGVSGHKSPVAQRRPTLYRNDAQTHLEVNKFVDDTQMYGSGANYHGREMESVDLDSFELVDEDNEALLRHPRSAFIPEMSPLSGHAYESPYSFQVEEGQDVSGHSPVWHGSGQRGAQGFLGLACSPQDGLPPLEAGHIPDSFPHDVFANCGFTQGSYVDVPMAEAYDGYGFNAGHFN
ncbi:uncharacterized protein J4E78_004031 [Alternaria triticimaculans]|uniref:uncharacterized protein n=1 Tax=Alternaria triticimaculans TaxID=297637 RepID=UPI0020C2784A|nr:uncharacterized protein J4E78_004031 [Alternaria triticimaculans]KAI4663615.1 hypothetical protein J4E78_004031 [Alternaria triticimaculans]